MNLLICLCLRLFCFVLLKYLYFFELLFHYDCIKLTIYIKTVNFKDCVIKADHIGQLK